MVSPIDVKRKGDASVGYWVNYVTLTFDFTHDLDLWFFMVKIQNSCISWIVLGIMSRLISMSQAVVCDSQAVAGASKLLKIGCLKAEFQMHTALSDENGKFYTTMIYIRASAGRYVFRWDRLLDEGLAFVQAGVPSCPDDVTLRSCTREFQMWRRRCKQIDPHWFQGRQMRFWWMLSTMSWK